MFVYQLTFNNPLKACFLKKKYILYVKSEKSYTKIKGSGKYSKVFFW